MTDYQDEQYEKLKEIGFRIIRESQGIECSDWVGKITAKYAEVDIYAAVNESDPFETLAVLESYWWDNEDYTDPNTGIRMTFSGWARYFLNDTHEEIYARLEELTLRLSE